MTDVTSLTDGWLHAAAAAAADAGVGDGQLSR